MIKNLKIVRMNLFRGSAPNEEDVKFLYEFCGIRKIISLDQATGEVINDVCQKLHIAHIIINIDCGDNSSLKNLLEYSIDELVDSSIPTFVHCFRGKDRTGMLVAIVRCLLDNWSYCKAIKEAKLLGFGTGLRWQTEHAYCNLVKNLCRSNQVDSNEVSDIVSQMNDYNDSYLDEQMDPYQQSWMPPMADPSYPLYPGSFVDIPYYSQDSRLDHNEPNPNNYESVKMPDVGTPEFNSQITNITGPSVISGGFL